MKGPLKVAAIQARSTAGSMDEMLAGKEIGHAIQLLRKAARKDANLACFPELYPAVGEHELAVQARELGIYVVAGLLETHNGHKWNTAVVIGENGDVIGRQPKAHPTIPELRSGVKPKRDFQVFKTPVGNLAIQICADLSFFEDGIRRQSSAGFDLLLNPARWFALSDVLPYATIGRHLEYGRPIVAVNVARMTEGLGVGGSRLPPSGGFSTIVVPPKVSSLNGLFKWFEAGPSLKSFAAVLGEDEEIRVAEIDLNAARRFPGYFSGPYHRRKSAAVAPS